MPATVSQVSAGLKTRLATITGLRTFDYVPDQINPPLAIASLDTISFHNSMANGDPEMEFLITVVLGRINERTATANLDGYTSPTGASSIRAAIEADRTLGGVANTCIVTGASNIRPVTQADAVYLAVDFNVTVYA